MAKGIMQNTKEFKTVKTQKYYERFGYKVDSVGMVKNDLPDYDI